MLTVIFFFFGLPVFLLRRLYSASFRRVKHMLSLRNKNNNMRNLVLMDTAVCEKLSVCEIDYALLNAVLNMK